ncbi:hypothetical protein LCGC14_0233200 [marine sediment metagenome]
MRPNIPSCIYSVADIRDLDARIVASGTSGLELMKRAAQSLWDEVLRRWPATGKLTVLCGAGNNAGDGYLVATLALRAGWSVRIIAVSPPERLSGDAALAWQAATSAGVDVEPWAPFVELDGVVVDALLGTGLKGDVREPFSEIIKRINASGLPVVSVDIPSGLKADSGRILGDAIKADVTVTFIALKLGLFTAQGPDQTGHLRFAALANIPAIDLPILAERLTLDNWGRTLPQRPKAAHKGLFGHLVVIGGDHGMGGAIMLAAEAALRSGSGRVSVVTRPEHVAALLTRCPEVMVQGSDEPDAIDQLLKKATAVVVGPGLGRGSWGQRMLDKVLAMELPCVLDADALNSIAERNPFGLPLGPDSVITPHPAEAARLLGWTTAEVQNDRLRSVNALVERFGCAVVLKGVGSLIAGPVGYPGLVGLCSDGNPGMATAGMGDVLSGLAGALLAQRIESGKAARYAALVHALAGDMAERDGGQCGILASDLITHIRNVINRGHSDV